MCRAWCFWAEEFRMKFQGIVTIRYQPTWLFKLKWALMLLEVKLHHLNCLCELKQDNLLVSSGFKLGAEFPPDCGCLWLLWRLALCGLAELLWIGSKWLAVCNYIVIFLSQKPVSYCCAPASLIHCCKSSFRVWVYKTLQVPALVRAQLWVVLFQLTGLEGFFCTVALYNHVGQSSLNSIWSPVFLFLAEVSSRVLGRVLVWGYDLVFAVLLP